LEQISKLEKNSKIGTNFEIGFFLENGTNHELEQILKMEQLSNWKKFQILEQIMN
jgi:hypothetical protein